mmetsp:Transcript_12754/g.21519  ORF Transcript_12754/g.21519 Transcript_12754/m.21519 type:complete len:150 (+) Transcript_12754:1771-2220(+)
MNSKACYMILRKYWDPRQADNAKNMKDCANGNGVVFDVYSDKIESFMSNYEELMRTQSSRVDFTVAKIKSLPELCEDDDMGYGGGGNWRDFGNSRGGGFKSGGGGGGGGGGGYNGGFERGNNFRSGGQQDDGYGGRGRGAGRGTRGARG